MKRHGQCECNDCLQASRLRQLSRDPVSKFAEESPAVASGEAKALARKVLREAGAKLQAAIDAAASASGIDPMALASAASELEKIARRLEQGAVPASGSVTTF